MWRVPRLLAPSLGGAQLLCSCLYPCWRQHYLPLASQGGMLQAQEKQAGCVLSVWFWQSTSIPPQQQIGDFDLPAPLDVFRKLTAFPRSSNCFYRATLSSGLAVYQLAPPRLRRTFPSVPISLPRVPSQRLTAPWCRGCLRWGNHSLLFFLDTSKQGGDMVLALLQEFCPLGTPVLLRGCFACCLLFTPMRWSQLCQL